ncbi:hypothetical protein EVA_21307, partial [gut metagenome]
SVELKKDPQEVNSLRVRQIS